MFVISCYSDMLFISSYILVYIYYKHESTISIYKTIMFALDEVATRNICYKLTDKDELILYIKYIFKSIHYCGVFSFAIEYSMSVLYF